MCTLIVDCGNFMLEHPAYLVDENGETKGIAQLPTSEIAGFALQSQVNKICLSGGEEFCFGLQEEISRQLMIEYANNDIEIEVI